MDLIAAKTYGLTIILGLFVDRQCATKGSGRGRTEKFKTRVERTFNAWQMYTSTFNNDYKRIL